MVHVEDVEETEQLGQHGVRVGVPEERGEGLVEGEVRGRLLGTRPALVRPDDRRDHGARTRDDVQRVLEPVARRALHREPLQGDLEPRHRVPVARQALEQPVEPLVILRPRGEVRPERRGLVGRGQPLEEEEVDDVLGGEVLEVADGVAHVVEPLLGVHAARPAGADGVAAEPRVEVGLRHLEEHLRRVGALGGRGGLGAHDRALRAGFSRL